MAKKSRRARIKGRVAEAPQRFENKQLQPKNQPLAQYAKKQPAVVTSNVIQVSNHDYVKSDLIHVGIIAGALILILIILTFVPALKA